MPCTVVLKPPFRPLTVSYRALFLLSLDQMLYLDATELIENPGMSLRRVADFTGVPPSINENNFYFDEEKGMELISRG